MFSCPKRTMSNNNFYMHAENLKGESRTMPMSQNTVKPVLIGHSKIDKMKALKTGGSLMQVESIAECS